MFTSRAATALLIAILLIMVSFAVYVRWRIPPSPAREAANRAKARERWMELVAAQGNETHRSWAHAKLLASCFKEGEPAAECESVLATAERKEAYPTTGSGNDFDGAVEYIWRFTVEKPRKPDETGYVLYVRVQGSPPIVRRISGSLTMD